MSKNRLAGTIYFKVDGQQHSAKGSWTYNLGKPKRTTITGPDRVHGYSEMPKAPFIDGVITDSADLDLAALQTLDAVTCTLELANGKTIILRDSWYVADGDVTTESQEIQARFEGLSAEEMKP